MEKASYQHSRHAAKWARLSSEGTLIDKYCSSQFWGVPLCQAFQSDGELVCYENEYGLGTFYERAIKGGELVLPADSMWLLGTPILSPAPLKFLRDLLIFWRQNPSPHGLRQILISGLYDGHPLWEPTVRESLSGWEIENSARMVADLEGGMEGFLSRRSRNFRSRLRRMVKAAKRGGVSVEFMSHSPNSTEMGSILERIFTLEEKSWKGLSHVGVNEGPMQTFYQIMLPLLAQAGRLRGLFLRRHGFDVAYLFGAYFAGYFRGLQFSFVSTEDSGLGNVCQYHMIEKLVSEGCKEYDLGQAMEYKTRWAEHHLLSHSFVFQLR